MNTPETENHDAQASAGSGTNEGGDPSPAVETGPAGSGDADAETGPSGGPVSGDGSDGLQAAGESGDPASAEGIGDEGSEGNEIPARTAADKEEDRLEMEAQGFDANGSPVSDVEPDTTDGMDRDLNSPEDVAIRKAREAAARTGDVVDASLDPDELQDLNSQLVKHEQSDRNPGPLPPGVNAADPLQDMAVLPGGDRYTRWLEGLVEHYRGHTAELRGLCRRVGVGAPELPHYPDYVAE